MSFVSGDVTIWDMKVSRLAPSPTGVLHLGNARTFLLNWLWVRRAATATLQLRIEDIDGPRVRPDATAAAIEDLTWLGLDWDGAFVQQSDRLARYREVVDRLLLAGLAYPCVCSRKEVDEAASAPHESWQDAAPYPGTCRGRFASLDAARDATGRAAAVRFSVEVDAVPFVDRFRGPEPGRIAGDFVIQKRDGGPAYQLAVVVDDAEFGIDFVLRGDDLLASTPRQLLLYRALGLREPQFAHVPLLVGVDGLRLAKRHGDTSLRAYRDAGVTAEQIVGYLASVSGLLERPGPCSARELVPRLDPARVPRRPVVVTPEQLGFGPVG